MTQPPPQAQDAPAVKQAPKRIAFEGPRLWWYRHITCRTRWKWVHCHAHLDGYCCHSGYGGPDDAEFMGCQADHFNDWIAARWWRRWVADARRIIAAATGASHDK